MINTYAYNEKIGLVKDEILKANDNLGKINSSVNSMSNAISEIFRNIALLQDNKINS